MRRHRVSAFTLIELLVVVAVVALLIAIVLPSLGKARERGRMLQCLSNLRALSMASLMYQGDYSGYFPAAGYSTPLPQDWIHWQPGRGVQNGAIVPYTGGRFSRKVYLCPSDPLNQPVGEYQYSYTANVNVFVVAGLVHPTIPGAPIKFNKMRTPGSKVMLAEEDSTTIDDAAWAPQEYTANADNVLAVRHTRVLAENRTQLNYGKGVVSFVDGHVDQLSRADAMSPTYYDPKVP